MSKLHSWRRTIAKGLTYRLASFTLASFGLGYFFSVALNVSLLYNGIMAVASMGLYLLNETLWRRTAWGKPK